LDKMRLSGLLFAVVVGWAVTASVVTAQVALAPTDGNALLKAGKYSAACEAFEAVLEKDPANADAQTGEVSASERLALEARSSGKMDDALRALLQAQQFVPQSARLLYDLGILEDEMKLYRDADSTLARLEKLGPETPETLYAVARVKLDLGQLEPAEQKMRQYLELKPDDASAHFGLGRIYRQGLQLDKAEAEFERCIALQPRQTEGYYELGDTQLQANNYGDALANFSKTLERNQKHGGALVGTGVAYFKQKQYEKAIEALRKAVNVEPDYQPGHYYLGLTLARMGRQEESKRELEIAQQMAERDNKEGTTRLRLNEQAP
jgi:tetratricopeptide (TPR) repeat protein